MNNNTRNNSNLLLKCFVGVVGSVGLALILWDANTTYQTDLRQQAFFAEYAINNELMKEDRGSMKRDIGRLSSDVAYVRSHVNGLQAMKNDIARLIKNSDFVGTHMSDIEQVKADVAKNSQWIDAWYKELDVPARDQRQDDAIEILKARSEEERERLRDLELGYAELGGPNDPLYKEIERLQRAIDKLSD